MTVSGHRPRHHIMKTLAKHTMVYDADCPLCIAYTKAFITTGMLDNEGRIPYQQVGGNFCPGMDAERAKNEIALINRETGEVKYGLDSLLTIIGSRFRWISAIARTQPLNFLIKKLYNFISYNRKVIIPAAVGAGALGSFLPTDSLSRQRLYDCTPTFKLKYRIAYLLFTWLITSLVLVNYSELLGNLIPATNFTREFIICGGQVLFQAISVGVLLRLRGATPSSALRSSTQGEAVMDYLGNMMTVSLMGALLLLPMLVIGSAFSGIHAIVFLAYFMGVVGVMLLEHMRRMKILELGWWPSISWVLYRVIVVVLLLAL